MYRLLILSVFLMNQNKLIYEYIYIANIQSMYAVERQGVEISMLSKCVVYYTVVSKKLKLE